MSEPTNGMLYHVELDDAGEVLTIEASQNGERISSVEVARSAWPSVVKAATDVEYDRDGYSQLSKEAVKKRLFDRIAAYEDGQRDAESNLAVTRAKLDEWVRLAERLAWHLSEHQAVLAKQRITITLPYGDGADALTEFRSLAHGLKLPRDYESKASQP